MAGWQWLGRRDVETRTGELAGPQRLDQRRFVDQLSTRNVYEKGGRPHRRDHIAAHDPVRADAVHCGDRNDISVAAGRDELAPRTHTINVWHWFGGAGDAAHLHVESLGLACDRLPNFAKADNHQML